MPDRTGIFLGWPVNLSNFLGLGVEAGASPMYPQKMRVPPPPGVETNTFDQTYTRIRFRLETMNTVNSYKMHLAHRRRECSF